MSFQVGPFQTSFQQVEAQQLRGRRRRRRRSVSVVETQQVIGFRQLELAAIAEAKNRLEALRREIDSEREASERLRIKREIVTLEIRIGEIEKRLRDLEDEEVIMFFLQ